MAKINLTKVLANVRLLKEKLGEAEKLIEKTQGEAEELKHKKDSLEASLVVEKKKESDSVKSGLNELNQVNEKNLKKLQEIHSFLAEVSEKILKAQQDIALQDEINGTDETEQIADELEKTRNEIVTSLGLVKLAVQSIKIPKIEIPSFEKAVRPLEKVMQKVVDNTKKIKIDNPVDVKVANPSAISQGISEAVSTGISGITFPQPPPMSPSFRDSKGSAIRGSTIRINRNDLIQILAGDSSLIVREFDFGTAAQTDTNLAAALVSADERIYVVRFEATCDNANSVNVSVRAGFGTSNVPTASSGGVSGMISSHPGLAAGGGIISGNGAGIISVGSLGEEPRVTSSAATGGNLHVLIGYYIIS